jgi:hypothetical protein
MKEDQRTQEVVKLIRLSLYNRGVNWRVTLFFDYLILQNTVIFPFKKERRYSGLYSWPLLPSYNKALTLIIHRTACFSLVCAYAYNTFRLFKTASYSFKTIILTAFLLASIALTKVIFGYVIVVGLLLFGLCAVIKKSNELKKTLLVYVFALFFCLPYLIHTYTITDQFFYWGNAGGMQLYWMSSPYPEELGDWYSFSEKIPNYTRYHKEFIDTLTDLNYVERDKALKNKAIDTICHNPKKYVYNWIANISRLLFEYPRSYFTKPSNHLYYYWPNVFVAFFSCLFIFPTLRYIKKSPLPYARFSYLHSFISGALRS